MKVYTNANVYTLDERKPRASAFATQNGEFVFVGEKKDLGSFSKIECIDLHGKTILPTFCDSHLHLLGVGGECEILNLKKLSFNEIINLIEKKKLELKEGDWIIGRGYDDNRWDSDSYDFKKLNAVTKNNPVFLKRVDGHAAIANFCALKLANLNEKSVVPEGGKIIWESGVLIDKAMDVIEKIIPHPDKASKKRFLKNAQNILFANGISKIHDMGIDLEDALLMNDEIENGNIKINCCGYLEYKQGFNFQALDMPSLDKFKICGLKVFMDGALGSKGAYLTSPYEVEKDYKGLLLTDEKELGYIIDKLNFRQLAAHAIGDGAIAVFLNVIERFKNKIDKKFRLEHVQILNGDLVKRLKDLKKILTCSVQPSHYASDKLWAHKMIGMGRMKYAYAWKSIADSGCNVVCGSDAPVDEINPIIGIHNAVNRGDGQGLKLIDAVKAYTINAAQAVCDDKLDGSISNGKFADFVVLSDDIFKVPIENIKDIKVEMTTIKGEVQYHKGRRQDLYL